MMLKDKEKEHYRIAKESIKVWKKGIKQEQRRKDYMLDLFSCIFSDLSTNQIPKDIAESFMRDISSFMYPPAHVSKRVFENKKMSDPSLKHVTYQEYLQGWKEAIDEDAKNAFNEAYPDPNSTKIGAIKTIGSMNYVEYKKQREYAESFPLIDPSSITLGNYSKEAFDELEKELLDMLQKMEEEENKVGRGDK